jgi:hypothetical protein
LIAASVGRAEIQTENNIRRSVVRILATQRYPNLLKPWIEENLRQVPCAVEVWAGVALCWPGEKRASCCAVAAAERRAATLSLGPGDAAAVDGGSCPNADSLHIRTEPFCLCTPSVGMKLGGVAADEVRGGIMVRSVRSPS